MNITEMEYLEGRIENDDTFKFDLLALANKQDSSENAWEILRLADKVCKVDDFVYQQLRDSVARSITQKHNVTEFTIHRLFEERFSKENDMGIQITQIKNDPRHIPDCWVAAEGNVLPVEIKLGKFDAKAREQIERYIEFYGTKGGIAVGEKLTTPLPDHIKFIAIKDLKAKDVS